MFHIAGQRHGRQIAHGPFVDLADPVHGAARKQAGHIVRPHGAVVVGAPEGHGLALQHVLPRRLTRHGFADSRLQDIVQVLVGVQIEHPVRIGLRQGEIPLGREILVQGVIHRPGARLFGDGQRPVRTAAVDEQDIVRHLLRIGDGRPDLLFFIFRQDDDA